MLSTLNSMLLLESFYSRAFVVFWGLMLICSVCLWIFGMQNTRRSIRLERALFWVFGSVMVLFCAVRPIGITPDDLTYVDMYKSICPTFSCGRLIQSSRDWGWYGSVGLIKSFFDNLRLMLLIGAFALSVKLLVIFNLSKRPLLALALFFGVFYQVQDVTAFRVSLSLAIFMAGIWLLIKNYKWQGALLMLSAGLFHKQAVLSPWVAFSFGSRKKLWTYFLLVLLPVMITLLHLYPHIQVGVDFLNSKGLLDLSLLEGLNSYLENKNNGQYVNWRVIPLSIFPIIFLMVFLGRSTFYENKEVYVYASTSCILACWLLWGFADIPTAQVRFFEYFALPVVLFAGNCRGKWWEVSLVMTVSSIFVYRYNIWTELFIS